MTKTGLTTHILNLADGKPAADVRVELWRLGPADQKLGDSVTDRDGRTPLLAGADLVAGVYELRFHVDPLFKSCFYGVIPIRVQVVDPAQHYHVPLLISPFGYSTYRGS